MAELPSANVTIDEEAGAFAGTTGYCAVIAPVWKNADVTPRVFTSTKALLAQHDYSPGADYVASHFEETGKPVVFVGVPIADDGSIGSEDDSGVTGNCTITVTADTNGVLDEVQGEITVVTGGVVGTAKIVIDLSMDGGITTKRIRLGTNLTYTVPYVGIVLNFATGGTLVAGDVFTFATKGPTWDDDGIADARAAMAAQLKQVRSFMVIGDADTVELASAVLDEVNAYETSNDRYVYARVSVRDRLPLGKLATARAHMSASGSITFAEVGATGDTITRTTGSFITDGFHDGDWIQVTGAVISAGVNNVQGKVTTVAATILTLDTTDLADEVAASGVAIVSSPLITFAEVGVTGDTITRSRGSWIKDGFRVGDTVAITGAIVSSGANNVTGVLAGVTDTVLTFGSTDLTAETIGAHLLTITVVKEKAAWMSEIDDEFDAIDDEKRIDLSAGRAPKGSPITKWNLRRPASWAASLREYQHDLHIPVWAKELGPCDGFQLEDAAGNVVEYDERVDGGGLAARFTVFRTWGNGPRGAFIALSLTRDSEANILSRTQNLAVANLTCSIVQAATELGIGRVFQLKPDGTADAKSKSKFEQKVTAQLKAALLGNAEGEGPRASSVKWVMSATDDLSGVAPTINGVTELRLGAAVEKINTKVRIQTAGS